jgi:hypothetical protein
MSVFVHPHTPYTARFGGDSVPNFPNATRNLVIPREVCEIHRPEAGCRDRAAV